MHQAPGDVRAWTYLGRAYLTLGDQNDAARAFLRALQIDRNKAELYSAYGEALVGASHGAVPPEAKRVRACAHARAEGFRRALLSRLCVCGARRQDESHRAVAELMTMRRERAYRQELVDRIARDSGGERDISAMVAARRALKALIDAQDGSA